MHTTIGAAAFHFRVREGIGWFHSAMVTRERVEGRRSRWIGWRTLSHGLSYGFGPYSVLDWDVVSVQAHAIDVFVEVKRLEVIWSSRTDH